MLKNIAIVASFLLAASSCNVALAQSIKDDIKSAGINTCQCINNSKYFSSELVSSVFNTCQIRYLSKFEKQDYSSYEFDDFGNPIGELLNSYLNEMITFCPFRMAEFKESKSLINSDKYVTGKYIKIRQNGIFEEVELLGECGNTYNFINTTNYITKESLSPLAKEQNMSYYQFIIAYTEYPVKLFYKELAVIDTESNLKTQINFVTDIDTGYANHIELEKLLGTYKDNCNH